MQYNFLNDSTPFWMRVSFDRSILLGCLMITDNGALSTCSAFETRITMATQELEQRICQQFGWSARYFTINDPDPTFDGCWAVEVTMGLDQQKTFVSADKSNNSIKGRKQGKTAVALLALEGLKENIRGEIEKPAVHGLEVAASHLVANTRIVESSGAVWRDFWKNPPDAVGVDTEGNSLTPPVLVQIATDETVILEFPTADGLSYDLRRLLNDDCIIKVFCDSPSRKDKISLGLNGDTQRASLVDLEELASLRMGHVNVPRGLSNLLCLVMPELGVRIIKESVSGRLENVGTFTSIEQGFRPRLRGIQDLSTKEVRYATVDAVCTLQIWRHLTSDAI